MFNKFSDMHRYSDEYLCQEDDEYDASDEQEEALQRNLDSDIRKIKRAAFESCIFDIEADDDHTLVKNIWSQIQRFVQKPYVREVSIIAAIYLLKTGLFMAYRAAHKQGLEIVNL